VFSLTKRVHGEKLCGRGSYHVHVQDASLPVPDQQIIALLVDPMGYHAQKVATCLVFAIARRRVVRSSQTENSLIGRKGMRPTGRQCAHK
jgi:hypothetical protein